MVLQVEELLPPLTAGAGCSGRFLKRTTMRFVLILVLFNFQSGSEVITAEFEDEQACQHAAKRTFQGVDARMEIREMEILEGQEVLAGTMIAYDENGGEIGMFACNPIRTGAQNQG